MDHRQIVIANLAKGTIGEQATNVLGSLLVSHIQLTAMARSAMPPEQRVPHFIHVDEFQSFTTDAFASIFSEARKFAAYFCLANQYTKQNSRDCPRSGTRQRRLIHFSFALPPPTPNCSRPTLACRHQHSWSSCHLRHNCAAATLNTQRSLRSRAPSRPETAATKRSRKAAATLGGPSINCARLCDAQRKRAHRLPTKPPMALPPQTHVQYNALI